MAIIEVLRLNHRIARDKRISTHVALTARAFGANKIYYSGERDSTLDTSVNKITEKFGGPFKAEYTENGIKLLKERKDNGFLIVHLTVYGEDFKKYQNKLKNKNMIVVVGGEKVQREFYDIADLNLSVTNQPHSEVSSLAVFLYDVHGYGKFKGAKAKIVGSAKGKILKQI